MSIDLTVTGNDIDLPLQETPGPNSIEGRHPSRKLRFAYRLGRRYFAPMATIDAVMSGDAVMQQVRQAWDDSATNARGWYYIRSMFYERVVFQGTIATIYIADVETATAPREVIFSSLELSPDLSASIEQPELLQPLGSFAQHFPDIVTGSMTKKFLVVALKVRKQVILQMTSCALFGAALIGLVVGLLTQSVQTGFGCFGGLGLAISIALGIVLETHK